jgi:hypothetical protein
MRPLAEIQHAGNDDAVPECIERGDIALRIRSEQRYSGRRRDRVSVHQSLRAARQHDARQIVAAEYRRLLGRPLRHHHCPRPDLDQVIGPDERDPMIRVVTGRERVRQELDSRMRDYGTE